MQLPIAVAVGPDGRVYLADSGGVRIRAYDPATDEVTVVAGTGALGLFGDAVPALAAQLGGVAGLAMGEDGTLFLAELLTHRIRAIGPGGEISALAGVGVLEDTPDVLLPELRQAVLTSGLDVRVAGAAYSGDTGPALEAELASPIGLTVGPDGSVYVADTGNDRIRVIGDGFDLAGRGSINPKVWVIAGGAAFLVVLAVVATLQRRRRERARG